MTEQQAIDLRDAINGSLNTLMAIQLKGSHIYFIDTFTNMKYACEIVNYLEKRSIDFTCKFHRSKDGTVIAKFKFLKTC